MRIGRGELQLAEEGCCPSSLLPQPLPSEATLGPGSWEGDSGVAWRYRFSGLRVALVLLSWRRPLDPAHRIWGSACSVAAAPWSAGLGRRRADETGRAVLQCCARTQAPGKYRCYQLGSSGRLQPVGQAALSAHSTLMTFSKTKKTCCSYSLQIIQHKHFTYYFIIWVIFQVSSTNLLKTSFKWVRITQKWIEVDHQDKSLHWLKVIWSNPNVLKIHKCHFHDISVF